MTAIEPLLSAVISPQAWLVSVVAVIVVGLWLRSYFERRLLVRLAKRMGYVYRRAHDDAILDRYRSLEVMRRGHSQQAVDVITGTSEHGPLICFRLLSELGSRGSRTVLQHLIVIVELDTGGSSPEAPIAAMHQPETPPSPTDFTWHVDPRFLAGVCAYHPNADQVQSLLHATLKLAGKLQT